MTKTVYAGFKKWSISIDDDFGSVLVTADMGPIALNVTLNDLFAKDARKIGEMFIQFAELVETRSKLTSLEAARNNNNA